MADPTQEKLFETRANDGHAYDETTYLCECGHDCHGGESEAHIKAFPSTVEMYKMQHIFHRVELGLMPYVEEVEPYTEDEKCAACRGIVSYEMISGNTRIRLCAYSAREYAIIMHHMFKVPLISPFTCDCKGCVDLARDLEENPA